MITKKTMNQITPDFMNGEAILIDKPSGWSSFKVVHKIRQAIGVKKVGHAGTLDPFATGLLILCTGSKTKEITSFQDLSKTYKGIMTLGKFSESMDTETEIKEFKIPENISEELILKTAKKFVGEIIQMPPMYSAIKKNGKSLYLYARKGKTVEREPRKVNVFNFIIDKIDLPEIHFTVECSKGTYIRVLADDFGKELGTRALLTNLRRTGIGNYNINDALTVSDFISFYGKKKKTENVN